MQYYVKLIATRKWFMFLAVVAALGAAFIYLECTDVVFESSAKILLMEDSGVASLGTNMTKDQIIQKIGMTDPIITQIEILKTWSIQNEVLTTVRHKYKPAQYLTLRTLSGMVRFTPIEKTNVIQIICRSTDKELSTLIVNTFVDVYIHQNQVLSQQNARVSKEFLEAQLSDIERKLDAIDESIVKFKIASGSVSPERQAQLNIESVTQFNSELVDINLQLESLNTEKKRLLKNISSTSARSSSNYSSWLNELDVVNTRIEGLNAKKKSIEEQIEERSEKIKKLPNEEKQLSNLIREREVIKDVYATVSQRLEQYKIREVAKVSQIKLLEPAFVPEKPVSLQTKSVLLLACVIGLFGGFGCVVFMDAFDKRPRSLDQIRSILPCPIIGTLPAISHKRNVPPFKKPDALIVEYSRVIAANLLCNPALQKKGATLLITSAISGEGKSFVSFNMANIFSAFGYKTVYIGMDLRKPTVSEITQRKFTAGIAEYLSGEVQLDEILYVDKEFNFTFIPEGNKPFQSVLQSVNKIKPFSLSQHFDSIKQRYDILICDTSPALLFAEPYQIAPFCDGVVFVIDSTQTTTVDLENLWREFSDKRFTILGSIINKIKGTGFLSVSRYEKKLKTYGDYRS